MQEERDSISIEDEDAVEQYAALLEQQAASRAEMRAIVMQPRHALPFLQPGRLVRVLTSGLETGATSSGEEGAEQERAVHGTAKRVRLVSCRERRIESLPRLRAHAAPTICILWLKAVQVKLVQRRQRMRPDNRVMGLRLWCSQVSAPASTSGRGEEPSVWAAVINFERLGKADAVDAEPGQASNGKRAVQYIVDVLANCAADTVPGQGPKR